MSNLFIQRDACINCRSTDLRELSSHAFTETPLRTFFENDPWGESPLPRLADARWRLMICNACSQKFHGNVLSDEGLDVHFNQWVTQESIEAFLAARASVASRFVAGEARVRHILRIEKLTRGIRDADQPVRLVDFGCGFGEFLTACVGFGFDVSGVDLSPARHGRNPFEIYETVGQMRASDGGRQPYHAATLFQVLEHVRHPRDVLESLHACLVRGGVLILETPDCTGVTDIVDYASYRAVHPLEHINAFTPQTLRSIAERAGFRSIATPVAFCTSSRFRAAKQEARAIRIRLRPRTQQYFVKA